MTDLVTMLLVLGAGWYAYKEGMLDELVNQLKAVDLSGGGAAPTTPAPTEAAPTPAGGEEYAEPPADGSGGGDTTQPAQGAQPAAATGGDLGCGFTVRPMDSDPNRWRTDDAQGKEVSGGKVYLNSKEEQEKWSREECAKRGGGGGSAPASTTPAPASDSGGSSKGGGSEDKGGGDSGGGGDDEGGGGDDKESNYAISTYSTVPINWC